MANNQLLKLAIGDGEGNLAISDLTNLNSVKFLTNTPSKFQKNSLYVVYGSPSAGEIIDGSHGNIMKLSDRLDLNSGADADIAATPLAIKLTNEKIGDLNSLKTNNKNNVIEAINEIKQDVGTGGGDGGYIIKPSVLEPSHGQTEVGVSFKMKGGPYRTIITDNPRTKRRFEIAKDKNFKTDLVFKEVNADEVQFDELLAESTQYFCRIKDFSAEFTSAYSDVVSFTTGGAITIIPPTVTVQGEPDQVGRTPTIQGSAFSVALGSQDTHEMTDWALYNKNDTDTVLWSSLNDTEHKTSITIPDGQLITNTSYIVKVRYKGTQHGWSNYGTKEFKTKLEFNNFDNPTTEQGYKIPYADNMKPPFIVHGTVMESKDGVTNVIHDKTEWQIWQEGVTEAPVWKEESTEFLRHYIFDWEGFKPRKKYYVKFRYHEQVSNTWTEYAQTETITMADTFIPCLSFRFNVRKAVNFEIGKLFNIPDGLGNRNNLKKLNLIDIEKPQYTISIDGKAFELLTRSTTINLQDGQTCNIKIRGDQRYDYRMIPFFIYDGDFSFSSFDTVVTSTGASTHLEGVFKELDNFRTILLSAEIMEPLPPFFSVFIQDKYTPKYSLGGRKYTAFHTKACITTPSNTLGTIKGNDTVGFFYYGGYNFLPFIFSYAIPFNYRMDYSQRGSSSEIDFKDSFILGFDHIGSSNYLGHYLKLKGNLSDLFKHSYKDFKNAKKVNSELIKQAVDTILHKTDEHDDKSIHEVDRWINWFGLDRFYYNDFHYSRFYLNKDMLIKKDGDIYEIPDNFYNYFVGVEYFYSNIIKDSDVKLRFKRTDFILQDCKYFAFPECSTYESLAELDPYVLYELKNVKELGFYNDVTAPIKYKQGSDTQINKRQGLIRVKTDITTLDKNFFKIPFNSTLTKIFKLSYENNTKIQELPQDLLNNETTKNLQDVTSLCEGLNNLTVDFKINAENITKVSNFAKGTNGGTVEVKSGSTTATTFKSDVTSGVNVIEE